MFGDAQGGGFGLFLGDFPRGVAGRGFGRLLGDVLGGGFGGRFNGILYRILGHVSRGGLRDVFCGLFRGVFCDTLCGELRGIFREVPGFEFSGFVSRRQSVRLAKSLYIFFPFFPIGFSQTGRNETGFGRGFFQVLQGRQRDLLVFYGGLGANLGDAPVGGKVPGRCRGFLDVSQHIRRHRPDLGRNPVRGHHLPLAGADGLRDSLPSVGEDGGDDDMVLDADERGFATSLDDRHKLGPPDARHRGRGDDLKHGSRPFCLGNHKADGPLRNVDHGLTEVLVRIVNVFGNVDDGVFAQRQHALVVKGERGPGPGVGLDLVLHENRRGHSYVGPGIASVMNLRGMAFQPGGQPDVRGREDALGFKVLFLFEQGLSGRSPGQGVSDADKFQIGQRFGGGFTV